MIVFAIIAQQYRFVNISALFRQGNSIYFLTDKLGFIWVNVLKKSRLLLKIWGSFCRGGVSPPEKSEIKQIKFVEFLIVFVLIVCN